MQIDLVRIFPLEALQKYVNNSLHMPLPIWCGISADSVMHINIYITGHNNLLVRIIDLASHAIYVVCINLIHEWWDLEFK